MPSSPLLPFVRLPLLVRFAHHASSGSLCAKASFSVLLSDLFPSASSEARSSAHRKWARVSSGVDVPKVFEKAWKREDLILHFTRFPPRHFESGNYSQTACIPPPSTPPKKKKKKKKSRCIAIEQQNKLSQQNKLAHRPHAKNQTSKQPKSRT